MLVIICAGTFGGFLLDNYLNWGFPLFVVIFSLLSVVIAIYISVKDLIKK
jgi:F0F1-type ATP synthase assembly protein I